MACTAIGGRHDARDLQNLTSARMTASFLPFRQYQSGENNRLEKRELKLFMDAERLGITKLVQKLDVLNPYYELGRYLKYASQV
jgi:hypothetical protein